MSINIHVYEHSVVMHTDAMLGNDSAQRLGPPQEVKSPFLSLPVGSSPLIGLQVTVPVSLCHLCSAASAFIS